jgi:hypothetical protein
LNQTNTQNTRHVNNNDINYDTELDNTEESDDDDTGEDINYDTPSEDEEK